MWLINARTLALEEVQTPQPGSRLRYTILSHRWRPGEVLFEDLQKSTYQNKLGFAKLEACCRLTLSDGYDYAWVDSCCIDKRSSAELSEAINSMYDWYEGAGLCYAYLDDCVSAEDMGRSEWFTRGWTLQELIAPWYVIILNHNWEVIGTRQDLRTELAAITGIDEGVLEGGRSASYCSVAQRMSWAAKRTTTRIEDMAYCLMGLFDVNMPILYGEGWKAFTRLQEEIIKKSSDHSLFAWNCENASTRLQTGLLARTPDSFDGCGDIIQPANSIHDLRRFYNNVVQTNQGISIQLPMLKEAKALDTYLAILNCVRASEPDRRLGILLRFTHLREDRRCVRVGDVDGRPINVQEGIKGEPVQLLVLNDPLMPQTLPQVIQAFFIGELQMERGWENVVVHQHPHVALHNRLRLGLHVEHYSKEPGTAGVLEFTDSASMLSSVTLGFDRHWNPVVMLQERRHGVNATDTALGNDWIKDPALYHVSPRKTTDEGGWFVLRHTHYEGSWYLGLLLDKYFNRSVLDDRHLCVRIKELDLSIAVVRNVCEGYLGWIFQLTQTETGLSEWEQRIDWESEIRPNFGRILRTCTVPADVLAQLADELRLLTKHRNSDASLGSWIRKKSVNSTRRRTKNSRPEERVTGMFVDRMLAED